MRVYPAAGLAVRDPATLKHVPAEGLDVHEHDLTWARLLRDGDVVTTPPAAPAKAEAPKVEEEAAEAAELASQAEHTEEHA